MTDVKQDNFGKDISGTAAAWLVRLEGQTTPQMWDEFQAWIDADRRNEAAFIRLRTAWTRCDRFKLLRPSDGHVDRNLLHPRSAGWRGGVPRALGDPVAPQPDLTPPADPERRRWLIAAGAVAALGAGPAMLAWLTTRRYQWTYYETPVGANQRAVLADRSSVLLNTNTRVRVRLASSRRDSELMRGEALFTIAQDKLRPFYVKAASTLVCAVGTSFCVRIHEDRKVEVLVAEGRIAFGLPEPGGRRGTLEHYTPYAGAGDCVTFGTTSWSLKHESPDYVARKLAWISGRISFDGETLAEAVREFNRYNNRHFSIADPAIATIRVGGLFDATDPDSFAATLEKHFGVQRLPDARGDDSVIRLVGGNQRMAPHS